MGALQLMSSVVTPARMRAESALEAHRNAFYSGEPMPGEWNTALSAAGVTVTPELSMTLSAMFCGVTTICYDFSTLPAQVLKHREDGGKDRVMPLYGRGIDSSSGVRSMAYMLRWQPNLYQTATEYFMGQVTSYLLRGRAYAEIISGPSGFLEQLLPRHPDRVKPERLPSGRIRYQLRERNGVRYLTQDEMHVVYDLSLDGGLTSLSRVEYGAHAIGSALATQRAAGRFFKTGMTASTLATYAGGHMDEKDEDDLHKSISRYAAGMDNSFGLLLVPDDIKIQQLGVEPEKAQMMLAQEWGVREVARLLRMPGHKLGIKDANSYNSQIQAALDYVIGTIRPIAVTFEQAMQRDLVLAKDTYLVEFLLAALLRGDFTAQSEYLEKFLQNRVMWPSEARMILNLNPDEELDELWKQDHQPGKGSTAAPGAAKAPPPQRAMAMSRASVKGLFAIHDNAQRCVRRERVAVEKLARKHANDVAGWQASLREFYTDQAGFVSQTMRISIDAARAYAAQHGSAFEASGVAIIDGAAGEAWERCEAEELAVLALGCDQEAA